MAEKSKILIIGGTGYIGKHIVEASVKAGHETFALVRESTMSDDSDPTNTKAKLLHNFRTMGVNLVLVCKH
jgi:pterocarpan reductase